MLQQLCEFREKLDSLMCRCINRRITLYGFGYTGRFIKWYAKYYHNIDIAYCITEDMQTGISYDAEIYHDYFFKYNYKDFKDTLIWLAVPYDERVHKLIADEAGKHEVIDFYKAIYGNDYLWEINGSEDIYHKRKEGLRDIQFMEYLEWKYDCNFISMVDNSMLTYAGKFGSSYRATTQKELFPILDACHCKPKEDDALFDFGCGKGSVLIGALDYGFEKVGGVEYEPGLYEVMVENRRKLSINENRMSCYCEDAANISLELDDYNWFYFWDPFGKEVLRKVAENIIDSTIRNPRRVHIVYSNPKYCEVFGRDEIRLVSQFTIETRQKVVAVFENIKYQVECK